MAGFASVAAVGRSLERLLSARFEEEEPVESRTTRAVVIRTEDLRAPAGGTPQGVPSHAVTIYLYRVDLNQTMRAAWSGVGSQDGRTYLPLDLHYLLTPWGDNAEFEHRILGRAMECLEATPVLTGPLLHASGGWAPGESVQLSVEEMSTEALLRVFDCLPTDYKLSVPYVARVVRLESREARPAPGVRSAVTGIQPELDA